MFISKFYPLIFLTILSISTLNLNAEVEPQNNEDIPDIPTEQKLRILIVIASLDYMKTHYDVHKALATMMLQSNSVEYVHLLALTTWHQEEIINEGNNLTIEFKPLLPPGVPPPPLKVNNVWEEREYFVPSGGFNPLYFGLFSNDQLIQQLNELNFNVGVIETLHSSALAVFQRIPSIRKTIATLSFGPLLDHLEYLGYDNVRYQRPNISGAEIGDHEVVGKSQAMLEKNTFHSKRIFKESGKNLRLLKRKNEIEENNKNYIDKMKETDLATYEEFNKVFTAKEGKILPKFDILFRQISFLYLNTQKKLDFRFMEKEYDDKIINDPEQKIHFMGGIAVKDKPSVEIDEETANILRNPTILVSFGTAVSMNKMPKTVEYAFILAFERILRWKPNLRIIWKEKDLDLENRDKKYTVIKGKLFLKDWLPQPAIIAHKNTKLFIGHAGMNSIFEAAHYRVPMVLVPLSVDQQYNAESLADRDLVRVVDHHSENLEEELYEAMKSMLKKFWRKKPNYNMLEKKDLGIIKDMNILHQELEMEALETEKYEKGH